MKRRRKKNISPTVLCLGYFKKRGVRAVVVEKWIKFGVFGGIRRDVFGADIQVLYSDAILAVQAGIAAHASDKVKKAIADPDVRLWLSCVTRLFQIWTWKKRPAFNADGKRSKVDRWTPKVTSIVLREGKLVAEEFILQ